MSKRRKQPKPAAAIRDFTDQLRASDQFEDARVVVFEGERRVQLHTRRRANPATRWCPPHSGMLTRSQAAALVVYSDALEEAGWMRVKSCMAEPSGAIGDTLAEARFDRSAKATAMARACEGNMVALIFTNAALNPDPGETFDDLLRRMNFRGTREQARQAGAALLRATADALIEHLETVRLRRRAA